MNKTIATTLLIGLLASTAPSALGQTAAPAPADAAAPVPVAAPPTVDESALRYFARQGDQVRLEAEIARLSALYPEWQPPADPLAEDSGIDNELQAIWDIFGTGDMDAVRSAIEERQTREPGWQVPDDLEEALQLADAREQIVEASDADDDETVIAVAATYPQLLECQNMDTLWRLGEAFVETGRDERGLELYTYILENCENPSERLATMQKAAQAMGIEAIEPLFAYERQVEGRNEFDPIRLDVARQNIADATSGATMRVDDAALADLRSKVETDPTVGDLQLLGYYELNRGQARTARDLFRRAYETEPSADTAMALAVALMRFGDPIEAEAALAEYRTDTPETEELYLSVVSAVLNIKPLRSLDADLLGRISETIIDTRSSQGAHDLGWYAYGFRQYQTAAQWFETALSYNPSMESAAYGLVVASNQLRDRARIQELQQEWGEVSPRIRLFGRPNAPTEAPVALRFREQFQAVYQPAVLRFEWGTDPRSLFMLTQGQSQGQIRSAGQCGSFVPPESLAPATALGRAWCLMDLNRNAEAEGAFRRATQAPSEATRTEAYYGLALALLRLGLPNDAAVAAAAMPQPADRATELQVAILSDSAVALYKVGKFEEALQVLNLRAQMAPERNDLLVVRAWSYFHLGYTGEARRIFKAVAAAGYADAQRGLEAVGEN